MLLGRRESERNIYKRDDREVDSTIRIRSWAFGSIYYILYEIIIIRIY